MKTIVIVEDEPTISDMYKIKLGLSGFKVHTAVNGEEGLEVIKKRRPDLILLDLKMPMMNGEDMLEKLRQTKSGANIPVIVLTNISPDEAPESLSKLDVKRYVVKAHYTPSQVVTVVKEVLADNKR